MEKKGGSRDDLLEQQTFLARFGELALKSDDLNQILTEACRLVGTVLRTNLAKVLELQRDGKTLLVRAGFGWPDDVVGKATISVGPTSSAGHAISSGEPVVSNDIENETRFEHPEFLQRNGVKAAVNTIIIGREGEPPYGVLEVDSKTPDRFTADDIHFLRTYANLLSATVARLRMIDELRREAEEKEQLLRELQHRVRNNLQAMTSLVRLQQARVRNKRAAAELETIGQRIEALGLVHEKLYGAGEVTNLSLGSYLAELAASLLRFRAVESGKVRLVVDVEEIQIEPRRASPLGMIVNEFIVNSLKYAFDQGEGTIGIRLESFGEEAGEKPREEPGPDAARLTLWDDGKGLPRVRTRGLGMRLIEGFARQIGADLNWENVNGTRLVLMISHAEAEPPAPQVGAAPRPRLV